MIISKDDHDNNYNLSPPPSPSSFPPPPPPQPPSGRPPTPPPFFPPPSGKFLQSLRKNEPPFQSSNSISIPPAPSAPPLTPDNIIFWGLYQKHHPIIYMVLRHKH